MSIDHAWNGDHVRGVDYFGSASIKIHADGSNGAVGNQDVSLGHIADFVIHADDRGASNQKLARGRCQRCQQLGAPIENC